MSRYLRRDEAINNTERWDNVLKKRNVKTITQYVTVPLKEYEEENLDTIEHTWKVGDKFWALADAFYGDAKYWYLIARHNNMPTEANVSLGDIIKIPINLSQALQEIG